METALKKVLSSIDSNISSYLDKTFDESSENLPQPVLESLKAQAHEELSIFRNLFLQGYQLVCDQASRGQFGIPLKQFEFKPFTRSHHPDLEELSDIQILSQVNQTIFLQEICSYSPKMMRYIYEFGCQCYNSKDFESSLSVAYFLIVMNPAVFGFWQLLGRSFEAIEKIPHAVKAYEMAINCRPEKIEGYQEIVRCCLEQKEFGNAMEAVEFGLEKVQSEHFEDSKHLKKELESLKKHIKALERGV